MAATQAGPRGSRRGTSWPRRRDVTKEEALAEFRKYAEQYPDAAPEIVAMGLLREIDSWEEFHAVFAALDEILGEQA